jgi:predicted secreted protein
MSEMEKAADNARKFQQLRQDFNDTGEQFLRTELDMAQSLIEVGETTCDPQHRDRSYQEAATGYRTIARILPLLTLPSARVEQIHAGLRSLRTTLGRKGVFVEEVVRQGAPG